MKLPALIYLFTLTLATTVIAAAQPTTSITAQYEIRDFKNSKQKIEGTSKSVTLEHNLNTHTFKAAYERTDTDTKQPPLPEDLKIKKLFARYSYQIDPKLELHGGFITIDDNLASTDGGKIYSLGIDYRISKPFSFDMTGYYGDYDIMKTCQIDAKLIYRHSFGRLKSTTILIAKQINIDECQPGEICANAKSSYFTPGFKQAVMYEGYYLRFGAFFGKRVFAVMHDGFKVQHHAMEFDKTMMAAIGKKFGTFDLMFKYVYQEAEELPINNPGVEVRNSVVSLGYRF